MSEWQVGDVVKLNFQSMRDAGQDYDVAQYWSKLTEGYGVIVDPFVDNFGGRLRVGIRFDDINNYDDDDDYDTVEADYVELVPVSRGEILHAIDSILGRE